MGIIIGEVYNTESRGKVKFFAGCNHYTEDGVAFRHGLSEDKWTNFLLSYDDDGVCLDNFAIENKGYNLTGISEDKEMRISENAYFKYPNKKNKQAKEL